MPIGFYKCKQCGSEIDAFIADDKCPECGCTNLEYWDVSTYCDEHPEECFVDTSLNKKEDNNGKKRQIFIDTGRRKSL